jgi:hypothetical protein
MHVQIDLVHDRSDERIATEDAGGSNLEMITGNDFIRENRIQPRKIGGELLGIREIENAASGRQRIDGGKNAHKPFSPSGTTVTKRRDGSG